MEGHTRRCQAPHDNQVIPICSAEADSSDVRGTTRRMFYDVSWFIVCGIN